MNSFCLDAVTPGPHLRPSEGVLRPEALSIASDAKLAAKLLLQRTRTQADGILEEARKDAENARATAQAEADRIRAEAQAEAENLLTQARDEAAQLIAHEQEQVLTQSAEMLRLLSQAQSAFLDRSEDMVIELVQTLFDRVVTDSTPRERIESALRYVVQEAPPKLVDALLRVNPADVELLGEVEWPVKADRTIERGSCRLEAANGQWCANFNAAVEAVKTAFLSGVEETRMAAAAAAGAQAEEQQEEQFEGQAEEPLEETEEQYEEQEEQEEEQYEEQYDDHQEYDDSDESHEG